MDVMDITNMMHVEDLFQGFVNILIKQNWLHVLTDSGNETQSKTKCYKQVLV